MTIILNYNNKIGYTRVLQTNKVVFIRTDVFLSEFKYQSGNLFFYGPFNQYLGFIFSMRRVLSKDFACFFLNKKTVCFFNANTNKILIFFYLSSFKHELHKGLNKNTPTILNKKLQTYFQKWVNYVKVKELSSIFWKFNIINELKVKIKNHFFIKRVKKYNLYKEIEDKSYFIFKYKNKLIISKSLYFWNNKIYDFNHQYAVFLLKKFPFYSYNLNKIKKHITIISYKILYFFGTNKYNINPYTPNELKIILINNRFNFKILKYVTIKPKRVLSLQIFKNQFLYQIMKHKPGFRTWVKLLVINIFGNLKFLKKTKNFNLMIFDWISFIIINNQICMKQIIKEFKSDIVESTTDSLTVALPLNSINVIEKVGFLKDTYFINYLLILSISSQKGEILNLVYISYFFYISSQITLFNENVYFLFYIQNTTNIHLLKYKNLLLFKIQDV